MSKRKKVNRRARGTGAVIWSESRGCWIGRKIVGRTASGRVKYAERSGKTQEAVVKALEAAGPPGPDIVVRQWAVRWLAGLSVRPSTLEGYRHSVCAYIVPALGGTRVADVTPSQSTAVLKKLLDGTRAASTVAKVQDHARAMFEAARADGITTVNPFALARRPKHDRKPIDPFTPAELKAIIAGVADLSAGPLVTLLAATGCRLGEASALDIADWNPSAGTVAITKTYSKRFGVGPPKSKYSRRTITVPAAARPAVEAAAAGRKSGPLFVTGNGNRFIKSLVQRAFARALARLGLPGRNVHQLRHGVATALIAAGTPLGDAAKYLGDSVTTLVKSYLHASGSDPAGDLDKLLS